MDIISLKFVILATISFILFYLIHHKYRVAFLVLVSSYFIASLSYYLLAYITFYSLANFYIGLQLQKSKYKATIFRTGILFNLSQLVILRYSSFAIDPIVQFFNSSLSISKLSEIIIPVGISYFTLQGIGYLINIKMGWEKPEKKLLNFLLYIIYYPKFLSGPLERSSHFLPQLLVRNSFNDHQVSEGFRIALFGFFKKIVIANQMTPFVSNTYANISSSDGSALWLLLLLQPLYLYFDFSGYTDIVRGFSKTMGIDLLPNFNRPFFAENMTTFWKRFHISLSAWFNDYVFRQISFKRRRWGIYASAYAVFITFILFGIWHGAGWNFMFLGFLQAVAINYEFFTKRWRLKLFANIPDFPKIWLSRLFTYLFYAGSLVFFFAPDINSAFNFFFNLFSFNQVILPHLLNAIPLSAIVFLFMYFIFELIQNDYTILSNRLEKFWLCEKKKNLLLRWTVYSSIIAMLFVLSSGIHQFIYAQF